MHPARDAAKDACGHVKARDEITYAQDGLYVVRGGQLRCRIDLSSSPVHTQQRKTRRAIGALHRAQARHGGEQRTRVRMGRLRKHRGRRALFHTVALVHDEHAVGHLSHHAHVVRDEHHRHVQLLLQCTDQLQDFGLDGHIQRRGRLIRNQQRRLARQRHRNHHALAHAARQLMRIAPQHVARFRNAHQLQHAQRLGLGLVGRFALVQADRFGNLLAHGKDRVERGHRLLEDHRDIGTAHAAHGRLAGVCQIQHFAVAAAQMHVPADDLAAAVFHQPHQRQRRHRLARARFAHHGKRFTAVHMERQVAHRVDHALGRGKAHAQVLHLHDALVGHRNGGLLFGGTHGNSPAFLRA